MSELWYPRAKRWRGNIAVTGYSDAYARSVGYTGNGRDGPKRGDVKHSAEGTNWDVIHDLLLTKSWHFTIGYDRVEQHHPWNVNCWHCTDTDDDGGVRGNFELVGIEHLGVAGQPLTEYQIAETAKLTRWLAEQNRRSRFRRFDGWDPDEPGLWVLAEHNEVANTYTACPSGRIPWQTILERLNEEDDDMAALALMKVAGAFAFLASDVLQGFPPNPAICREVLGLIGGGMTTPLASRNDALGVLAYAEAEALRGNQLTDGALRKIRYLCTARPVLPA